MFQVSFHLENNIVRQHGVSGSTLGKNLHCIAVTKDDKFECGS